MKSIIKSIFRNILRNLLRRPLNFVKRNSKQLIITYLLSVFPSTYMMTALTTQYKVTQPQQVIDVISNSGISNIIFGGFLQPISHSIKSIQGSMSTTIGQYLDSNELIQQGKNLKLEANSWFEQGNDLINRANSNIDSLKNQAESVVTDIKSSNKTSTRPMIDELEVFDFNKYPNYYEIEGLSHIDESQFPEKGQIIYSELDELGRTRKAYASLTYKNVESSLGHRGSFKTGGDNEPSGWITNKKGSKVSIPWLYGKSYRGYFYNRSHLIADQLGGEAIKQNAITGTRTQNVGGSDQKGGMRYSEKKATEWLKSNKDGILYYSAEPVYNNNELIARYVIVKMKSSNGEIDESIKVFNAANGWSINYNNGEYSRNE